MRLRYLPLISAILCAVFSSSEGYGQNSFLTVLDNNGQPYSGKYQQSTTLPSGTTFVTFPIKGSGSVLDIAFMSFDKHHKKQISTSFSSNTEKLPFGIAVNKNAVVICGRAKNVNGRDGLFVLKTDTLGNLIWYKTYGNNNQLVPRCVAVDDNGNVAIGGTYNPWEYGGELHRAFVLLLNSNGQQTTFSAINTNRNYPHFSSVIAVQGGGFMFCGQVGHVWDYFAAMVAKVSATGVIDWVQSYRMELPGNNYSLTSSNVDRSTTNAWAMTQINANKFALSGYCSDHNQYGSGHTYFDGFTLLIDNNGNPLKAKRYSNSNESSFYHPEYLKDGTITVSGFTLGGKAAYLLLMDTGLNRINEAAYQIGSNQSNAFYNANKTENGKYLITGATKGGTQNLPVLVSMDFSDKGCDIVSAPISIIDIPIANIPVNYTIDGAIAEFPATVSSSCFCDNTAPRCGNVENAKIGVSFTVKMKSCSSAMVYIDRSSINVKCSYTTALIVDGDTINADSALITQNGSVVSAIVKMGNCIFNSKDSSITLTAISNNFLGPDLRCIEFRNWQLDAAIDGDTYQWSTGETTRKIVVDTSGVYWVKAKLGDCEFTDSVFIGFYDSEESYLYIPSAFTPNGDGMNDYFHITESGVGKFNGLLFDRWGEILFKTEDKNFSWEGLYRGKPLPSGNYYYVIDYNYECGTIQPTRKGSVTLIR